MGSRVRQWRPRIAALLLCLAIQGPAFGHSTAIRRPLKVFILAGQSNMQGHANVSTLDSMADDPKTAPIGKAFADAMASLQRAQRKSP